MDSADRAGSPVQNRDTSGSGGRAEETGSSERHACGVLSPTNSKANRSTRDDKTDEYDSSERHDDGFGVSNEASGDRGNNVSSFGTSRSSGRDNDVGFSGKTEADRSMTGSYENSAGTGFGNKTTGPGDVDTSDTRFGVSHTGAYKDETQYGSGSTGGAGYGNKHTNRNDDNQTKDSTVGKLYKKAGEILNNENMSAKGHQKREAAGAFEGNDS